MRVFLETGRLLLRRFVRDDVDHLVALDSDPGVMRFLDSGEPPSREEVEKEILPTYLRYYERFTGFGFWAAVEKSTGEFLGWFELRPPGGGDGDSADPGDVELGYRLRTAAWGKGYATEGARALVRKAFTELGVQRVFATTMTVNTASRRVMEKAGLTYVRTFFEDWPDPIEGAELGDVEYELVRADWERWGCGRPVPVRWPGERGRPAGGFG
jgi:RimJ/RimL family protein N-acetyltransferase